GHEEPPGCFPVDEGHQHPRIRETMSTGGASRRSGRSAGRGMAMSDRGFGGGPAGGAAGLAERLGRGRLRRRDLLWLAGTSASAAALASLSGCATSPVTGETILVGMSEAQERSIDAQVAPHQFSQDLGEAQDTQANAYVERVGADLARRSHRPDMPYS